MMVFLFTIGIFALVMTAMAAGFVLTGRCLRGSCGGPEAASREAEESTCGVCGRNKKPGPFKKS